MPDFTIIDNLDLIWQGFWTGKFEMRTTVLERLCSLFPTASGSYLVLLAVPRSQPLQLHVDARLAQNGHHHERLGA